MPFDPTGPAVATESLPHHAVELLLGLGRRIRVKDAGVCLHDLPYRPERHALAVRRRAPLPPVDELVALVDDEEELPDKAALTDPGDADEREELRRARLPRPLERVEQQVEFAASADELRPTRLHDIEAGSRPRLNRLPDGHGLRLALGMDRLCPPVLDEVASGPICHLSDEDAVDRSRGLQPRCRVHDVARGHSLARGYAGAKGDERLAGR